MSRLKYSRLVVARKAKEDWICGMISLYSPLGLAEEGRDLVACFRDAESARSAQRALRASRVRSELTTDIPEEDPLEAFRAASRPFAVGRRFWIDPGDPSDSEPPADRIALRLPASRAFGTGDHESTRLILVALEDERVGGASLLDVGTGSGILALAAAALGARRVVACDTDLDAVAIARANLGAHSFGRSVTLVASSPSALTGSFDLVTANLLPQEFLPERASILSRVAPGGRVLLSGLPRDRERAVLARLRSRRWRLSGRRAESDWVCLCLQRD